MATIVNILSGILMILGMFISLRGYVRSKKSDVADSRSYFIGLAFILAGVGLQALGENM